MAVVEQESMSVFKLIKRRRSVGKMTEEVPDRQQIEQLLEAAGHAPNHHKVEPWRWIILGGTARLALGEIMAQSLAARLEDPHAPKVEAQLRKEREKLQRAPIIIVAIAEEPRQPNVLPIENIEAVAAAVQNMLLVAEELGLAAIWRTGDAAYDPHVKAWLGLAPGETIVSFLYLGYPAITPPERVPTSYVPKTTWLLEAPSH